MTDKYLKITNKSGSVSRISLEKLGLSTKRNDPETIGRFGSGIKFAPIAALRKNLEWWFTGCDSNGLYKMQYRTELEDGIECVVYDYGDYVKSSSFTIDAGVLSWIGSFQIYREAVSNAIDEAKTRDDWSITIVSSDEIRPVEGEFSVYITASPEIVEINENFDKYFCVDRQHIYESNYAEIYDKIDPDLRIYTHGVLVHHDGDYYALYDYNIDNIKLNEERNVSSLWDIEYAITRAVFSISDHGIIKSVISKVMANDKKYFEFDRMAMSYCHYSEPNSAWKEMFESEYGTNCVIYDRSAENFNVENAIKIRGLRPIRIANDNFYQFLKSAGVTDYLSILGNAYDVTIDTDYRKYPNLVTAARIAVDYIPELSEIIDSDNFGVFESKLDRNLGMTMNMNSDEPTKILINKEHVNDNIEHILATIIHEYDHYSSGISDNDYLAFRDLADRRIASLMIKFHNPRFFTVDDGVIKFSLSDIGRFIQNMNFTIAKIPGFDGVLISIGGRLIRINDDAMFNDMSISDPVNGILSPSSDGISLIIGGLTNISEVSVVG